ncbi:hypothetical protein HYY72_00395, partial [Candidatus Woesearchaeota archaeon]|nr:hypothetical protein [Candidatus Woesearchaeota archaeon]
KDGSQTRHNDVALDAAVRSYVNSCIDREVKDSIELFGVDPAASSQYDYYLNKNLASCADFSIFRSRGIEVKTSQVSSKVLISDRAIEAKVSYPIELHAGDSKSSFGDFEYTLNKVTPIGEISNRITGAAITASSDIEKVSTDGMASIRIPRGTSVEGNGEFKIEDRNFESRTNEVVAGNTLYSIKGVKFTPYAELTIKYSENFLPKNYNPDMLAIARYNDINDIWVAVRYGSVDKTKSAVSGRISEPGYYAIVINCKPSSSPIQINYTGWIYREQAYSSDRTLLNPNWNEADGKIYALKEHKQIKLSGGAGWNDNNARAQTGTPKGQAYLKDWDNDDQSENLAACTDCDRKQEDCKPICQAEAKKRHKNDFGRDDTGTGYLFINKDGIKDGTTSKCSIQDCEPYSCGTTQNPQTCYHKCPKDCIEVALATPNNYGYDSADAAGGRASIGYKLQGSGNSCVAPENAIKVDLRPVEAGGICNDECKAKLNKKDVNADDKPIPAADLNGSTNTFEIEIINKRDAASYARGRIDLMAGTGSYEKCETGKELTSNCICGTTNVNVLQETKRDEGDYGEWSITANGKKFCCADGTVADDLSRCTTSKCPAEKDNAILQAKNTGCECAASIYDYNRDGPGYCCSTQTCEGTKCTQGAGFASGRKAENDLNMHEYRLEYKGSTYSVYMDNKLLKSRDSMERPAGISFGNELRPTVNVGTWTSLKIDSIKVTDQAGRDIFSDEFEGPSINTGKWTVDKGEGTVDATGGFVELKAASTNKFPFVKSATKIFPDSGDFTLTVKMQYTKVTGHGVYFSLPQVLSIGQDDSSPGGDKHGLYRLRISLLREMIYACGGVGGCSKRTCEPTGDSGSTTLASITLPQGCDKPSKFGIHMMLQDFPATDFGRQLDKARELVGECGFVKNIATDIGINPDTAKWASFVSEANKRKLVPVLRLQGRYSGNNWEKPDQANNYAAIASKYAEFISQVEATSKQKVGYVEIWNEPNIASEWGGQSEPKEYARFLLAVAKAIRAYDMSDGKKDISIMNGGLAVVSETSNGNYQTAAFMNAMFAESPELKDYIDIWSTHSYMPDQQAYRPQLEILGNFNSRKPIMITETSWKRCGATICNAQNQGASASEFVNVYKNVWSSDNNVIAVIPFELTSIDPIWSQYNFAEPGTLAGNDYFTAMKSYRESLQKT